MEVRTAGPAIVRPQQSPRASGADLRHALRPILAAQQPIVDLTGEEGRSPVPRNMYEPCLLSGMCKLRSCFPKHVHPASCKLSHDPLTMPLIFMLPTHWDKHRPGI